MPLPVVKSEIAYSLLHEQDERKSQLDYVGSHLARIKKHNPFLVEILLVISEKKEKESSEAATWGIKIALTIYRMLESQQEVDDMEKEINL